MAKPKSWSVKGVDDETRDLARAASQAAGQPIGTWIDAAIGRAARGELPGIAVVSPEGTTGSQAAPTASPAPISPALPSPPPASPPASMSGPDRDEHDAPLLHSSESAESPTTDRSDLPLVDEPLVAQPQGPEMPAHEPGAATPTEPDRRTAVAGPTLPADEDGTRPSGLRQTPIPPRPRPLPILPAERRPGPLRYALAGAALLAILGGGFWVFSILSVPELPSSQREASDATPGTPPQATPDRAGTTPASPPVGAADKNAMPENVRLGIEMAKSGDARAQHDVGVLYLTGQFVRKDAKEAASWFEKAAVQGLAAAQFNLGVLYQQGEGVAVNPQLAVFWFQSAAEQNEPRAQHNLASAYAEGRGVARSYEKAVDWFTKAATAGLSQSQYSLARLYEIGSPEHRPDNEKAKFWYEKAAAQGDADAAERLRALNAIASANKPIDRLEPDGQTTSAPAHGPAASVQAPAAERRLTRAEVRELQQLLRRLNFDPGPADGAIGRRTIEAVRLFQKFAGLEADGEVSPSLLDELRAVSKTMGNGG